MDVRKILEDKGYTYVIGNEDGMSFVNEKIKTCVIYTPIHKDKHLYNDSVLREPLEKEYNFAEKGTICLFEGFDTEEYESRHELEISEFWAVKIYIDRINELPSSEVYNKDITVTFSKMEHGDDISNYNISPFQESNGKTCTNYLLWLGTVKGDVTVKYPAIIGRMSVSWYRYQASKLFKEQLETT